MQKTKYFQHVQGKWQPNKALKTSIKARLRSLKSDVMFTGPCRVRLHHKGEIIIEIIFHESLLANLPSNIARL